MNPSQTTPTTPTPITNAQLDAALISPLTHNADPELAHLRATLADLRSTSEDAARQHFIHASLNAKPATRFSFTLKAWSTLATAALLLGVFTPRLIHRTTPLAEATNSSSRPDRASLNLSSRPDRASLNLSSRPERSGVERPAAPAISDEALLASVQDDLDASVPSAMLPLTTSTSTTSTSTTQSTTQRKQK